MKLILAFVAIVVASAQTSCGNPPLCGQDPQVVTWPADPVYPLTYDLSFSDCCPAQDSVLTETCQRKSPTANYTRVISVPAPFSDSIGRLNGGELIKISGASFEKPEHDTCCPSCTCFGDPHCIDFQNREDKWVLCDARTVRSTHRQLFCPLTRSMCLAQNDHTGASCEWAPDSSSIGNWQVVNHGSPCIPNPDSPPSSLVMYSTAGYSLRIEQGERGIIKKVIITSQGGTYSMEATDCLIGSDWNMDVAGGSLQFDVVHAGIDYIWNVLDHSTGIYAKMRCTGNERPSRVTVPRINVEELVDLDSERISQSTGFCVTGEISEKAGESENTKKIESQSLCLQAEKNQVGICRALFTSDQLAFSSIESCKTQFCSRYASPNFPNADACISSINTDGFEKAFCQTCVGTGDSQATSKCLATINDFGWEEAIAACEPERELRCLNNVDELPDSLDECQSGVEVQYLINGEWTTFKAFPEATPPCPDAIFTFVANSGDPLCNENVVFNRPLRFFQRNVPASCHLTSNWCTSVSGFNFNLEFIPAPTVVPPDIYCIKYSNSCLIE